MNRIHPINRKNCGPHYGRPVCVMTNDGRQYIGILSAIRGGKLILNEHAEGEAGAEANRRKRKTVKTEAVLPAATGDISRFGFASPWQDHPFFRQKIAIELTAIALLLLLFI